MDEIMTSGSLMPERYPWISIGILAFPLLSFLINGLWIGRKNWRLAGWIAVACMGVTAALSACLALGFHTFVLGHPESFPGATAILWQHSWMTLGTHGALSARLGFYLDPISIMMVVVISTISFLVHFYSIGYMKGDAGAGRFFPLLSFFSFSMLGLVVAPNLIQTYFFWELVGVSSYLLIGFWYRNPSAVAAGKKAFILTRFADAFFLGGLIWVGLSAGNFDFLVVNSPETSRLLNHSIALGGVSINVLVVTTLLIYAGAWGKSAMFPLHVWLPDAMEGPTPVSSLIHSATMVVAGIYLVARLFPLFSAAEATLRVVETTGAFTAVFAAVIACTQTDIKRILAFSTLSQLGYMMLALGVAGGMSEGLGYSASMFHVFTHAFFKCLLFLSAGVVIHATHSNHVLDAGGLRKRLPWTYAATWIACLAITGLWPFSGFFSKEKILSAVFLKGDYVTFAMLLAVGGLTAFYMFRLLFLVFHGPAGSDSHGEHKTAESFLMTTPVVLLALPSAAIGWLSVKFFMNDVRSPLTAGLRENAELLHGPEWLPLAATLLALAGIGTAIVLYVWKRRLPDRDLEKASFGYRLIANKFYVDEFYLFFIRSVFSKVAAFFSERLEREGLNGAFDGVTGNLRRMGVWVNKAQNGQVQAYATASLLGLGLLLILRLFWNHPG